MGGNRNNAPSDTQGNVIGATRSKTSIVILQSHNNALAPVVKFLSAENTIASRDQFKPIRIGENLVVNYKSISADSVSPQMNTIGSFHQFEPIRIRENLI